MDRFPNRIDNKRPRWRRLAVVLLTIVTSVASTAGAAIIDFNIQPGPVFPIFPADIAFVGGMTPLVGRAIPIVSVTASGTPDNAGTYNCIECELNFQTGNFIGAGPNAWLFAPTGPGVHVAVTGGLDTDGDFDADIPVVMLGNFVGPQVSVDIIDVGEFFSLGVTAGIFLDVKNPALTSFFGLPPFPYVGGLVLGWGGIAEPPGPIFASVTGGIVRNTFVPEPGTFVLLGAGFGALVSLCRRRRLS